MAPADRLIVAADINPEDYTSSGISIKDWVEGKIFDLIVALSGTGVYIKLNSALRLCGYEILWRIRDAGLRVFTDLKLNDISETLAIDGAFLHGFKPDLLTVMCSTGQASMRAILKALPEGETEVLGVTVLTSLTEEEISEVYRCDIRSLVKSFARQAELAGLDGLIASPAEAAILKAEPRFSSMTINTPGIRPSWAVVKGDDQNKKRSMTPAEAIKAGADRIVVGRPITLAGDPREAVMRTLEEIKSATFGFHK